MQSGWIWGPMTWYGGSAGPAGRGRQPVRPASGPPGQLSLLKVFVLIGLGMFLLAGFVGCAVLPAAEPTLPPGLPAIPCLPEGRTLPPELDLPTEDIPPELLESCSPAPSAPLPPAPPPPPAPRPPVPPAPPS